MKRYYITDRKSAGGFRPLFEIVRDQMHLGVDYVQIREKDISARELFEFTLAVLEIRQNQQRKLLPAKVLVNTRADVAVAAGADGVHLTATAPRESLPGLLIGRSCHTLDEVKGSPADFVTFGPVFDSPGKKQPTGLAVLHAACLLGKEVFALGGVTWGNAADCMQAGAAGIAGIRLFQDPDF